MPNPQITTITADGTTYDIVDTISGYAPKESPALTGVPTAPTAASGTDTTQIATTAFVQDAIEGMGAGSVTSVAVSNATNGGLSVSGSPITDSGTITIGHSNILTSAQTTQAVYPIKIDKNGHISDYGTAVTIPVVPENTGNSTTGISIADHSTSTVTGVQSTTTSVTGVQATTTTASHVKSGGNGTAPTLGTAIEVPNVTGATDVTVPIRADSATTVPVAASSATTVPIKNASATSIPNVTDVGSASNWAFENITVPIRNDSATTVPTAASSATTVPIKNATATSIPNVTAAGSGSFTQGSFSGGAFTQGTDSFTANTPTVIDTTKFNAGSYSHTGFSGGSGSFTQGSFSGGSIVVTNHVLSFTPATHGADSHTHTGATYGTDSFTAPSLGTGFYTAGTVASFTQGEDEFTPATHGADSHTHTPPTLGTAISIYGVQSSTTSVTGVSGSTSIYGVKSGTGSTTTASHVASGGNGTAPTLGDPISIIGVQSSTTSVTGVSGSTSVYGVKSGTNSTTTASKVTLGTAIEVPNVTSVGSASNWVFEDVTVPIKNASATTVPIKDASATTVVTTATHSVTDNGHTHSLE